LSVSGGTLGTGANWVWYAGSCGGSAIGSGTSIGVSPSSTTNYYVRAEGTCNTTVCAAVTAIVNPIPAEPSIVVDSEMVDDPSYWRYHMSITAATGTIYYRYKYYGGDWTSWGQYLGTWYYDGCGFPCPPTIEAYSVNNGCNSDIVIWPQ
jgi:hypothetical protein